MADREELNSIKKLTGVIDKLEKTIDKKGTSSGGSVNDMVDRITDPFKDLAENLNPFKALQKGIDSIGKGFKSMLPDMSAMSDGILGNIFRDKKLDKQKQSTFNKLAGDVKAIRKSLKAGFATEDDTEIGNTSSLTREALAEGLGQTSVKAVVESDQLQGLLQPVTRLSAVTNLLPQLVLGSIASPLVKGLEKGREEARKEGKERNFFLKKLDSIFKVEKISGKGLSLDAAAIVKSNEKIADENTDSIYKLIASNEKFMDVNTNSVVNGLKRLIEIMNPSSTQPVTFEGTGGGPLKRVDTAQEIGGAQTEALPNGRRIEESGKATKTFSESKNKAFEGFIEVIQRIGKNKKSMFNAAKGIGMLGLSLLPLTLAIGAMGMTFKLVGIGALAGGLLLLTTALGVLGLLGVASGGMIPAGLAAMGAAMLPLSVGLLAIGGAIALAALPIKYLGGVLKTLESIGSEGLKAMGPAITGIANGLTTLGITGFFFGFSIQKAIDKLERIADMSSQLQVSGNSVEQLSTGINGLNKALFDFQNSKDFANTIDRIYKAVDRNDFKKRIGESIGFLKDIINDFDITKLQEVNKFADNIEKLQRLEGGFLDDLDPTRLNTAVGGGGDSGTLVSGGNAASIDNSQSISVTAGGITQLADDKTVSAMLRQHRLGFGYSLG